VPDRRRAWARALFLAAPDKAARAAYGEALAALASAVEREKRLRDFITDPSIAKGKKAAVLMASLGESKGSSAEVFGRFCSLLIEKGRSSLLVQIARSYGAMHDAAEGIERLEIEAAREVDGAALERIAQAWTRYASAKSTRASVRVNPSLIAGYRLRAGSLRIDYSVAGRLERLRRELAQPLGKTSASADVAPRGAARGEG
jgi:F-type H+-transporting ATPase subunit delta